MRLTGTNLTLPKIIALAAIALLVWGCQGARTRTPGVVAAGGDDPHLTGAAKIEQDPETQISYLVPYTGTGHTETMREIRRQVNPATFNSDLSKLIARARVNVEKNPDTLKPQKLQVTIGLRTAQSTWVRDIEFEGPLKEMTNGSLGNTQLLAKDADQFTEARYQLAVLCHDRTCDKVQMILKKVNLNIPIHQEPVVSEETGILYTRHETNYRVKTPKGSNSSLGLSLRTDGDKQRPAIQESVEVLDGPAYVRVRVPSEKSDEDVLVIEGELLRTTDRTSQLSRADLGGDPIKGVLLGNNEKGDIAIRLQGGSEGQEEATVFFEKPRDTEPPVQPEFKVVDSEIWASHPTAVIPVNFSDSKLTEAQQVTRQLEKFRVNSRVKEFIKYWTGEKKYRQCGKGKSYNMKPRAMNFFHKIKALVPYTTPIFRHLDVTPEILYVSALESQFAVSDGWIIEATKACKPGQKCSAAGPFQITELAARYLRKNHSPNLNFVTLPLNADRSVAENDDRRFFLPTTFAAASYAKDMIDWFPDHPELWPLGYTEGQGALAVFMKCSLQKTEAERTQCRKSTKAGTAMNQRTRFRSATLDDIVKYKMAPCDKLDYVLLYLAMKFVGANLKEFGLQIDDSKIPKKLPAMYRPNQNAKNFIPSMLK